jgi:membrane-bound lytic murein transglycosylase B
MMPAVLLALALASSPGVPPPAAPDGGLDLARPATWTLSARLPPGSPERESLIAAWTRDAGPSDRAVGEAALSRAEAEALLGDPRAELIYGERTVLIVAPSMVRRQRKDHQDLLKAFLAPERLAAGAAFARAHAAALERTWTRHRVEPEAVVSILMWETRLGTITGDFVAFNAFTSQAYFAEAASRVALSRPAERKLLDRAQQPKRVETVRARAQGNLVALVRQCKAQGMDPLSVKGSWAGALGYPQFMPASLRWAEDGNGDGRIDLFDFDDAIASVGKYLQAHGWSKSHREAVWGYNHEDAYVRGVLAYAAALGPRLRAARDGGTPVQRPAADAGLEGDGGDAGVGAARLEPGR